MWLLLPLVLVPMVEIALFIVVGGWIGLWPTLGLVVLTAILGVALVRRQGGHAMRKLRESVDALRDPSEPLADGAMILLAGVLLLIPGFFTDICGLALLLPPVRGAIYRWLRARVRVERYGYGPEYDTGPRRPDIIDGEYYEVGERRPTHSPSGWTRH